MAEIVLLPESQGGGYAPASAPAPPAPTPVPSTTSLAPFAAAALLNQYGRPGYPAGYTPASNIDQYLPYIIGGVVLLAVVMVAGK